MSALVTWDMSAVAQVCSVGKGQMSAVETRQMSSAETRQMSAVGTGQMSAVETGYMSSAETRQMENSEAGQRPFLPVGNFVLSQQETSVLSQQLTSALNGQQTSGLSHWQTLVDSEATSGQLGVDLGLALGRLQTDLGPHQTCCKTIVFSRLFYGIVRSSIHAPRGRPRQQEPSAALSGKMFDGHDVFTECVRSNLYLQSMTFPNL